jgi:spore maturation protein SpmA
VNAVFAVLVAVAVLVGAYSGQMPAVSGELVASADGAVKLALGLIGQMALWLGTVEVLKAAGLTRLLARWLRPVMVRLFPRVPAEHPAMSSMILNLAANIMGLGNAATPFGIKAMVELDRLNPKKGVATNEMALFLAINTSGVAVIPLGVMAIRASLGSANVSGIVLPSIVGTCTSTLFAVLVAKGLEGRRMFQAEAATEEDPSPSPGPSDPPEADEAAFVGQDTRMHWAHAAPSLVIAVCIFGFFLRDAIHASDTGGLLGGFKQVAEAWMLPILLLSALLFGFSRRTPVYEAFVRGAKEGFHIAVMIIPFLVAILVAVGMFRASGAMDLLSTALAPVSRWTGFPTEAIPMALIRPLSGSGAIGVMTEVMKTHGPDSFVGFLVSVMNGSTETTFYVLAVYFGAVRIRVLRHTLWACLATDVVGMSGAFFFSKLFF